MKFINLKCLFLFLIILIISQTVFCDDVSTENDNKSEEKGVSKDSQQNITTIPSGTSPDDNSAVTESKILFVQTTTTTITTTISINKTSESPTTTTTTSTTSTTTTTTTTSYSPSPSSSKSSTPTSSNNNHDNDHNESNNNQNQEQQNQQDQQNQQNQQNQPETQQTPEPIINSGNVDQSSNVPNTTNNPITTINNSKVDDNNNNKNDGVPTGYIILGIGIVAVIVAAVIGFTVAVQKKKKSNDLSPNMWSVPDDFDSRVIPIAPPANTYNMNNTPISQPPMSQAMYQNAYGQTPVMTDAYNQGQAAYADPADMQMPQSTGVAVPLDNSYSNDYPNANGEYLPTSIDELKVNNVYVSQFTFQPELDDEIEINIDDQIYIEEIFADNWALGVNTTNNARGCFPLNIFLNPKSTLDNSRSQRTLSYCSSGNGAAY